MPDRIRARMRSPDNPLQARARELGITLVERDWVPSPRRAHECTEHARGEGRLAPFHAAVLRGYWSESKDIHDWAVLEAAAVEAGLDPAAMRAAVESGAMKQAVDERIRQAHELGIDAVPTFVIDERLMVQGAQPLRVFEMALERLGL